MGEGVDPTLMCQSLVEKVAQSRQLQAITDPDLLVLFEDWLEELEAETRLLAQYRVKGVPTVVFLDGDGEERTDLRLVDFLPPEPFLSHMAEVAAASKKPDNLQ